VILYLIGMIMMRLKKERSIKMVKVTPSVHGDLIGMAKYGDSLSDVIERLIVFYKKNRQVDQK
jgi:predicted CopG family antitoxin